LKGTVRVNAAGCLDACAQGPSVVVYPQGIWYTLKTRDDALEVIEQHLLKDKIVEHLRMPG
jgi:(2Fe-2S) ferredoxin